MPLAPDPDTKIGSDKAHTKWCEHMARDCIKDARKYLGNAWTFLGPEVQRAFVATRVVSIIATQHLEELPVWRMQELITVTMRLLDR